MLETKRSSNRPNLGQTHGWSGYFRDAEAVSMSCEIA